MAANYQHTIPKYDNSTLAGQSPSDALNLGDFGMQELRNQRMEALLQASQSPSLGTTGSYNPHRGSVSNLSEDHNSASSAQPHRLSISSTGDFNPLRDGLDGNTSPDSGRGLAMKLDDSVSGDQADESTTSKKDDKGDPPPWSEMKTKAGKERKRLPLACIACRRKKIRCSGEKPACKHCLRSRIPCVYKVTTRKAAPRTDYMAMLDKRLKRMEDRVIKLIPKETLGSVSALGRSVVKPALPGAPSKSVNSKKRVADEAFGGELDDWSKSRSANPNEGGSSSSKARDAEESKLLTEGAESLPPKEMQEHLAEAYFDYVYGQSYPLLHKPSFMRRLAAGNVPPVLILAICAISARFSTHPQLRTEPAFLRGENWAEKAREIALKRYDTPNITILIVYLLLGLHEFGTCQGGRSWMFGGMAQRMAYALQLHKDLDYDPTGGDKGERKKLSFIDREIRRRTMWSCFLMDRFNSSGTDRPLFVNEQFIQAQLPIKEHFFINEIPGPTEDLEGGVPNPVSPDTGQLSNPKDNMGVAAYLIRLVTIWGRLIKFMNLGGKEREVYPMWSPQSTFHDIKSRTHQFKESLPPSLHYSDENLQSHAIGKTANQFLYLHILYQQILLFMNRFALPSTAGSRPPKDMPHEFLTEAARAALDAANQISILTNESMDYNVVAPFAGYSAFFSSTVHVHGVFSKNSKLETQSKKYLAYNVKYLSKMKKYWGMFHYIAENLKELYRQHADAVLRGASATNPKGGQASIFQYGDWFDRYPHGVSNTDYEDPAADLKKEPGTDAVLGQKSDLQSVEEFFASLSPPSRAEHQRKIAKKNKHAKSSSKHDLLPANASSDAISFQQGQAAQMRLQQHPHNHQTNHIPISHEAIDTSPFDTAYFNGGNQQLPIPPRSSFPPNFNTGQPDLSLLSTSPSSLVPQLDFSGFSDLSANPNNGFWNLDLTNGSFSNGFFTDPSTAWFLPFNMEPPTLGDDGGIFSGDGYNFGLGGIGGGGGDFVLWVCYVETEFEGRFAWWLPC
ncbi:hypothetical protein AOQ84DRAFT_431321 [Glonium stellatum]|uniref:Zn(2)-C6 fungal-type domain-containing protein n=1 Tax=Glonium stellatum TaxID=574774 RepID=A0A8E2JTT1_9PEZI|nr:hypothetical protein AOQ84DRAFT_431321 [Glonium stellatum]